VVLVGITNGIVGLGLLWLAITMLRRPQKLWVGVKIPRSPEEVDRVRRSNLGTAPWLLLLGLAEVVSGPAAQFAGLSPLWTALAGLVLLLLGVAVVAGAALRSR
jgi:hypothetical protein